MGPFFVEGLGRNAIAIGFPRHALQGNQPHPLRKAITPPSSLTNTK